ncbi:MAG: trigger factor [Lachnospiraceae bacterium]
MSLQVENLENNMIKLTIEVAADVVDKAMDATYHKQKGSINVPGFRKGKAPRKMIESMYGTGVFFEEAVNSLISVEYSKALDDYEGKEIVSSPTIDFVQAEPGKALIFTAEVAVKPEVTLGVYKGVEIDKVDVEVTDEEISAEIAKEQEKSAREITVEDRAVEAGDITCIDFEGFVDGIAFEGGKGTDFDLTIGSGSFIPGFEDQLIGAAIGAEVDVNVSFPEEYHAEDLAGKPALFKCVVKSIKVKELPELDDEFAAEVSEFETLAEYQADVKAKLMTSKEEQAKNAKEDAVMSAIIADASMDIPVAMLETQQKQMMDEFAQRLQQQGLSMEQYFQFTGMTATAMMDQVKPQAETRIKSRLVLEAIVAAESLVASDEDFAAEVARMVEQYKMEADTITEMLGEAGKTQMMEDLAIAKAAEFVVENAVEK